LDGHYWTRTTIVLDSDDIENGKGAYEMVGVTFCVIVTDTYCKTRGSVFATHGFAELTLGQVTDVPSAQVQYGSVPLNVTDTPEGILS
jgi:hypothetical protein